MVVAEKKLSVALKRYSFGIHHHLYNGFRQLFHRRNRYRSTDILEWLSAMDSDLDLNITRLTAMCQAACSGEQIEKFCEIFRERGFHRTDFSEFLLPDCNDPIAWWMRTGNNQN